MKIHVPKSYAWLEDYVVMVFLIFTSGSIFGISFYYRQAATVLVVLCAALMFLRKGVKFNHVQISCLFGTMLCMLIVLLVNMPDSWNSYIAIAFQLLASLFVTVIIDFRSFINKFVKLMTILAGISLVFFSISLVFPNFAQMFPMIEGTASLDYYNAIIHVFGSTKGYGHFVLFTRNSGIFWEPGAYQAFLNLALALLLEDKCNTYRNKKWMAVILMVTVITTLSTTGYLVLALIVIRYFNELIGLMVRNVKIVIAMLPVLLGVGVIVIMTVSFDNTFLAAKWNAEFGADATVFQRLSLADVGLFFRYPASLIGMSFETYQSMGLSSGNSLLHTMITLGVPFVAIILFMYSRFCAKFERPWTMLLLLLMCFSSESLFWRPLFLSFAWYGIQNRRPYTSWADAPVELLQEEGVINNG